MLIKLKFITIIMAIFTIMIIFLIIIIIGKVIMFTCNIVIVLFIKNS
jgi:hypothetical protein